jgi:hypothetical protein
MPSGGGSARLAFHWGCCQEGAACAVYEGLPWLTVLNTAA